MGCKRIKENVWHLLVSEKNPLCSHSTSNIIPTAWYRYILVCAAVSSCHCSLFILNRSSGEQKSPICFLACCSRRQRRMIIPGWGLRTKWPYIMCHWDGPLVFPLSLLRWSLYNNKKETMLETSRKQMNEVFQDTYMKYATHNLFII